MISENENQFRKPQVSIGLPVYNGDKFLEETLDSLLAQTYTDFEIIISDNASTDNTEMICRSYVNRDERIRYYRNKVNLGAAENYNIVFHLANGQYFKWAAADDLLAPKFLERCVQVLDNDLSVILSFSRTEFIDKDGKPVRLVPSAPESGSSKTSIRFCETVCNAAPVASVFGLIRAEILRKTRLIGKYSGSDRPLIGELSLRGRFYEIPETLFFYRQHEKQSWGGNKSRHDQQAWYDPSRAGKLTFPHWKLLGEHLRSVFRTPLGFIERVQCYLCVGWWIRLRWRFLANNLLLRDIKEYW